MNKKDLKNKKDLLLKRLKNKAKKNRARFKVAKRKERISYP